jgi:hypothetical protein
MPHFVKSGSHHSYKKATIKTYLTEQSSPLSLWISKRHKEEGISILLKNMALAERMSSLLADRQNDRLTIPFEILALYFATEISSKIFSYLIPQFNTLPTFRQRQLSIIFPIIAFKTVIITLFLSQEPSIASPTLDITSVDKLFHIVNHTAVGYLFEILYRPSPALLQGHHILLQVLTYYFILYLRYQSHYVLIAQLTSIFIVFGIGLTDAFVDLMVVAYRLAPEDKRWAVRLVKVLGWGSEAARGVEWIVLFSFLGSSYGELLEIPGRYELAGWILAVVLWAWTEVDDFVKIRAMALKFGMKSKDD